MEKQYYYKSFVFPNRKLIGKLEKEVFDRKQAGEYGVSESKIIRELLEERYKTKKYEQKNHSKEAQQ